MHQQLTAVDDGTLLHLSEAARTWRMETLCEDLARPQHRTDGTPQSARCLRCYAEGRRMEATLDGVQIEAVARSLVVA